MITHKNTETCTFFKKLSPQWKNNSFHKPVNNTKLLGLLELWLHVFKSSGLSDFQTLDLSVLHLMALQFGFLTKKWQPPLYFPGSLMQFPFWHVFTDIFESKFSRMDQIKFVKDWLQKIWRGMICQSRTYPFNSTFGAPCAENLNMHVTSSDSFNIFCQHFQVRWPIH